MEVGRWWRWRWRSLAAEIEAHTNAVDQVTEVALARNAAAIVIPAVEHFRGAAEMFVELAAQA